MVGWMECLSFRDLWQIGTSLTWRALYTYMEWVRAEALGQTKLAVTLHCRRSMLPSHGNHES